MPSCCTAYRRPRRVRRRAVCETRHEIVRHRRVRGASRPAHFFQHAETRDAVIAALDFKPIGVRTWVGVFHCGRNPRVDANGASNGQADASPRAARSGRAFPQLSSASRLVRRCSRGCASTICQEMEAVSVPPMPVSQIRPSLSANLGASRYVVALTGVEPVSSP